MTMGSRAALLESVDRVVRSPINYWITMVADLLVAIGLLVFGLARFRGTPLDAGAAFGLALLSWGLFEYGLHRWILHGPFPAIRRAHEQHHLEPAALISTPLFLIAGIALLSWRLLGLIVSSGLAALLVAGVYAGYNAFALLHHWQHHNHRRAAAHTRPRRLQRFHQFHHHHQAVNFGITTTFWDRAFGTFKPIGAGEPAPPVLGRVRAYWAKLTGRPTVAG
jgi:sterol desaturase/sphingolipid hydroxylase (fatty acid hydroxylase superfamily)